MFKVLERQRERDSGAGQKVDTIYNIVKQRPGQTGKQETYAPDSPGLDIVCVNTREGS